MSAAPTLPGQRRNHGRGHSYRIDGERVPSITGILRAIAKPGLVNWASGESAKYAINHWDELAELLPSERLDRIKGAPDEYRDARGAVGKNVHTLIEQMIRAGEADVADELKGYADAWDRFDEDWQPKPLLVEEPFYNRTAGYAGTPDLVAELADGQLWLLDWKTALKGIWPEIALQLAAARFAEFTVGDDGQELPVPKVDACAGIEIRSDGTYDLKPVTADGEAFGIFLYLKHVADFTEDGRDRWIGDALLPPSNGGAP
jgi:hypothetical protein